MPPSTDSTTAKNVTSNTPGGSVASMATENAAKPNPALKALGLPNFKLKLPSRNWMIFLSVTGTFTSLLLYDRYEKKRIQRKWCKLVSHIADEPMSTKALPRKLTVFLSAPPADGLKTARDHFSEYVKPILNAAALDWDVVEGRKENDVYFKLAERIRNHRRKLEVPVPPEEQQSILEDFRKVQGIHGWDGLKGDIVIGRQTWKEYLRGLHEGWLGPLDRPSRGLEDTPQENTDRTEVQGESSTKKKPYEGPVSFLSTSDYESAELSPSIPLVFDPSITIPHFHILGFFNTPIRIYRFLTRRYMADEIGEKVAAVVLSASRPYNVSGSQATNSAIESNSTLNTTTAFDADGANGNFAEQKEELIDEEPNWHKSVRLRKEDEKERVWLDDPVFDPRIMNRMRKFVLSREEAKRAESLEDSSESAGKRFGGLFNNWFGGK